MAAFVLSLGAQCLVGQDMTTAQMACCAATDHDCGEAAAAVDCCQGERAEQDQLLAKAQHLVPPPALVSTTIPAFAPLLDTYSSDFAVDTTTLQGESPPKYVLLATFLI